MNDVSAMLKSAGRCGEDCGGGKDEEGISAPCLCARCSRWYGRWRVWGDLYSYCEEWSITLVRLSRFLCYFSSYFSQSQCLLRCLYNLEPMSVFYVLSSTVLYTGLGHDPYLT
jgi:hypothetical protein